MKPSTSAVLNAIVTGPARDDDKICTDLIACFAHAQEKQIENRVSQRIGHTPIAWRHDANAVEFASAQKPAFGIRPEISELARRRFDLLTQLRANYFGLLYTFEAVPRETPAAFATSINRGTFFAFVFQSLSLLQIFGPIQFLFDRTRMDRSKCQ
jgi:hypothetical protein